MADSTDQERFPIPPVPAGDKEDSKQKEAIPNQPQSDSDNGQSAETGKATAKPNVHLPHIDGDEEETSSCVAPHPFPGSQASVPPTDQSDLDPESNKSSNDEGTDAQPNNSTGNDLALKVNVPNHERSLENTKEDAQQTEQAPEKKHDIVLLFADKDEELAEEILSEMEKVEIDGQQIDVCLFNDVQFTPDKVERPYDIYKSSLLVLVVQTANTPLNLPHTFLKNELVALLRVYEGRDTIRPLLTRDGLKPLTGLASIEGILWFKTKGRLARTKAVIEHERKKLHGLHVGSEVSGSRETDTEKSVRGLCLIISNWEFDDSSKNRMSTQFQGDELKTFFESRRFKVFLLQNKTASFINKAMDLASKAQKSCYDCFVVYFQSHGSFNRILGSDCEKVTVSEQVKKFLPGNCKLMEGKPRIFINSSCRRVDSVEDMFEDENADIDESDLKDFIFCYACQKGEESFKNLESNTGNIFTQEFLKNMESHVKRLDFLEIMGKVKQSVQKRIQYFGNQQRSSIPETITKSNIKLFL